MLHGKGKPARSLEGGGENASRAHRQNVTLSVHHVLVHPACPCPACPPVSRVCSPACQMENREGRGREEAGLTPHATPARHSAPREVGGSVFSGGGRVVGAKRVFGRCRARYGRGKGTACVVVLGKQAHTERNAWQESRQSRRKQGVRATKAWQNTTYHNRMLMGSSDSSHVLSRASTRVQLFQSSSSTFTSCLTK